MAICGLVITFSDDLALRTDARRALVADPAIELGDAGPKVSELRVPAVLEAGGKRDFKERWRRIDELAGVTHLDLAYVHYEDTDNQDTGDDNTDDDDRRDHIVGESE